MSVNYVNVVCVVNVVYVIFANDVIIVVFEVSHE